MGGRSIQRRRHQGRVATQAEKLVFISSMAAMADGGCATEELDISALYYAALEEADGTASRMERSQ